MAYRELGQPLIDKMIGRELVGHAVRDDSGTRLPLMSFYMPTIYFIARWLPWSLPAIAGIMRVFRTPATETTSRRFERFLVCYFLFGPGDFFRLAAPASRSPDAAIPSRPRCSQGRGWRG